MILNQFGRRNINNYQRSVLALQLEDLFRAKAKENIIIENKNRSLIWQNCQNGIQNTRKELSKLQQVGRTLAKVKKIEEKAPEETKQKLRAGEVTVDAVIKK